MHETACQCLEVGIPCIREVRSSTATSKAQPNDIVDANAYSNNILRMFVAQHEILITSGLQSLIWNAVGQKYYGVPVFVERSGGGLMFV